MPDIENSISGGGFFFTSFSTCTAFTGLQLISGIGAMGAWAHNGFVTTHKSRFIQVDIEAGAAIGGPTLVQLGTGILGSEQIWQPTAGSIPNAFVMLWTGGFVWQNPFSFIFPSSLASGIELCARSQIPAGVQPLAVSFYLFN